MTSYIISFRKTDAQGRQCWLVWPEAISGFDPEDALDTVYRTIYNDIDTGSHSEWNNGFIIVMSDGAELAHFRAEEAR